MVEEPLDVCTISAQRSMYNSWREKVMRLYCSRIYDISMSARSDLAVATLVDAELSST